MTISHGDPQTLYRGTWNWEGDEIAAEYRLVSRTVQIMGEKLPGPIQHTMIKSSRPILTFEGKTFRRALALDKSAAEVVDGVRQSSRNTPEQKGDASARFEVVTLTAPLGAPTTR